ncbi:MAG: hypothetical protein ACRDHG_13065, partial [Anaerolineales bacterium]
RVPPPRKMHPPYPRSWVDRLLPRIDHLPIPAWLVYLSGALLVANIPYLLGNPRTWGELSPNTSLPLIIAFIVLAYFSATYGALVVRSFRL